jgi:hypothetical protein
LDRSTGTELISVKNHKHKKVPRHHLLPLILIISFPIPLSTILVVTMAKGKRGFKFTISKPESLVEAVEELVPISNTD